MKRFDFIQVLLPVEEARCEMRRVPNGAWVRFDDITDAIEILRECKEYFDERADAEYQAGSAVPRSNEEMKR